MSTINIITNSGGTMSENNATLSLNIDIAPGKYSDELSDDTDQLRLELEELDVKRIDLVREGKIEGKGVGIFILGSLVVKIAPVALPTLVSALTSWLYRHKDRTVKLTLGTDTIELRGFSSKEQEEALQEFVRLHQRDNANR